MKTRKFLMSIVCFSLLLSGCAVLLVGAGAVIGVGTVKYVGGELKTAEAISLKRAWGASLKAMDDLKFDVTDTDYDETEGEIIARKAGDTKVVVTLEKRSETVTEFGIRVGFFGDEAASMHIWEQIKKRF